MKSFMVAVLVIFSTSVCFAETVASKSGELSEGQIIEKGAGSIMAGSGEQGGKLLDNMPAGDSQGSGVSDRLREEFIKESENPTTAWGKWLNSVKPYFDQGAEAVEKNITATNSLMKGEGLSPQEMVERVNAGFQEYYKELQSIVPPPELSGYHRKVLELLGILVKERDLSALTDEEMAAQTAQVQKLEAEIRLELKKVFIDHGVPQEMVEEMTRKPTVP